MDQTPIGRAVIRLAAVTALAGGMSLALVTAITVLSVIGRALIPLGLRPIPGDVELVQAGVLFAIFSFLPWCHIERGNAIVAILTDRFPVRATVTLEALWDAVMLIAATLIAWRLALGLMDKFGNGESTFILRIPMWIVYAAGMIGAVVFVVAAVYCVVRSTRNALSPVPVVPVSGAGE